MTKRRRISFLFWTALALLTAGTAPASAQGSRADYERAAALAAGKAGTVLRASIEPHWIDGGARLWYRRDDSDGRTEFLLVDCATGRKSPLFDHGALAKRLRESTGKNVDPERLPVFEVEFDGEQVCLLLKPGPEVCVYDPASGKMRIEPFSETKHFGLAPEDRVQRSRKARGPATVLFVNRLEASLALFWVDEGGSRRSYGEILAGGVRQQSTFAGHAWVLVGPEGRDRAAFVAMPGMKLATVRAGIPEPAPMRRRGEGPPRPGRRPERVIFRDHNVVMVDPDREGDVALTTDGTADHGYGGRRWFSPNRDKVVVMKTLAGDERRVYYVEAAPRDQLQPKLHSYAYPKPGDRLPVKKPHLFDLKKRTEIPIDDARFDHPWSIRQVKWSKDGSRFTFLYNQRGHQVLRIVAVDAATGETRSLVEDVSETFIDYSQKQVARTLEKTDEIIWSSERDGWHHLYLYDGKAGRLKNRITKGRWVVRGIDRVDEDRRRIWFRAGGIRPEQDPYHVHLCRVDFDGSDLVILTEGDGTHEVSWSPDQEVFVDRFSRVDLPPVTELRRAKDGSLVCELERADWSALLATGWRPPKRFVARGRDAKTDIWGIIRYPTNHDPKKSYPVIESIYAGPHGAHVPKEFRRHSSQGELAELGFIVVQIDGMGTNFRSKAFHDVCFKNLGDSGFPDRMLWMKAAALEDPSMDLTRVGIYGGSAGGQSAVRALLAHGDFYDAAAADCGCHDNRMDKIWWNEAWMGWPIGPHYREQSNVTQAHRLTGKLLLMVGAMDENVDPASTMQVVDALIRADKDFELIVFPGRGHGAGGSPYGRRRMADFFVRHLLGVEPRWSE